MSVSNKNSNPFKKVPVLEDESMGVTIFEFSSILRYIVEKYCDKGCCNDKKKICEELNLRQMVEGWLNENDTSFHLPSLIYGNHNTRFQSCTACDDDIVKQHIASLETSLDVYEKVLRTAHTIGSTFGNTTLATPDTSRVPYTAHMIETSGQRMSFRERESSWLWLTKVSPNEIWRQKLPASV